MTGLEQHEVEYIMTEFSFVGKLSQHSSIMLDNIIMKKTICMLKTLFLSDKNGFCQIQTIRTTYLSCRNTRKAVCMQ